jgi:DNA-binding transcriptional MerR regulator
VPLSRSRDYLSIGEVLEALRADFPDITVSKIRFLENEGLIAPERTESGYRKFYDNDVARLRHILALQRDQFLPLKVIRQRLEQLEGNGAALPALVAERAASDEGSGEQTEEVSLSRSELRDAAGLSEEDLAGLEEYSIIDRAKDRYTFDDLGLARAAAGLLRFGIEPRHMRMFRQAAEREAALIEQIVTPVALRRDADAKQEAAETTRTLAELTRALREALARAQLRALL